MEWKIHPYTFPSCLSKADKLKILLVKYRIKNPTACYDVSSKYGKMLSIKSLGNNSVWD